MKSLDTGSLRALIEEAIEANDLAWCSEGVHAIGKDIKSHTGFSPYKLNTSIDVRRVSIKLHEDLREKDRQRADALMEWVRGKAIYTFAPQQKKKLIEDLNTFTNRLTKGEYT